MSRTFSANAMQSKIVAVIIFYCLLHGFTLSSAAQVHETQEEIDRHKRMLKERERQTERQYLAEEGVLEEADDLHEYIRPRVLQRASSSDRELAEERAESMSWYYAKVGWTRDHFESLEAVGFDAFSFVRENKPASGVVLAELIIIGKVIGTEETLEPRDGYRSSILVKVEDVIKGAPASDTITIRQLSGRMADGDKKYVQY